MQTVAPLLANSNAVYSPIPELPSVMNTTYPLKFVFIMH